MTQPTVIFSLLDTPAFGGAEQYLLGLLYHLAAVGYDVVLATNLPAVKQRVTLENRTQPRPITCITAPYLLDAIGNWKGLIKYFLSLPVAISWLVWLLWRWRNRSVVALLAGFTDRLTFSPFIKWFGYRLVWIEIGPLAPTFAKNWGFPRWLYHLTQPYADRHMTTSLFTQASMVTDGGLLAQQITLVYPGVKPWTTRQLTSFKHQGQQLRARHHLEKAHLITFTGRLATENEVELLIQALAELSHHPHQYGLTQPERLHVLIIGDGPEKKRYQKLVRQLQLTSRVTFAGFVDEETKFSWLATSDVFVYTRAWELDGFGMTTIEAMSVGTPVLTTNFGPQIEIVTNGKTGALFQPHQSLDLARRLAALIAQPPQLKKMGRTGQRHVKKRFNQTHQLQLVSQLIDQL